MKGENLMTTNAPARTRRDRWADWAVVGTLAIALLLGWAVKTYAESQTNAFTDDEAGLTVRYPKNWLLGADEKLAFQALDPDSGEFKTTYQVRSWPIDATASVTPTLAAVLNDASLARAPGTTAFRIFDIEEGEEIDEQPTMESTYVYVVESSDLFTQRMPVVVMGLDIAMARGDQAYVFSLLASKDDFEDAEAAFRRFVKAAEIR
jgi:hypothetical protein